MENGVGKMENGAGKMENGAGKTGSAGKLNVQILHHRSAACAASPVRARSSRSTPGLAAEAVMIFLLTSPFRGVPSCNTRCSQPANISTGHRRRGAGW